jgi:hypothetical protein
VLNGIPLNQGVSETPNQPIPAPLALLKAQPTPAALAINAQHIAKESRAVKALRAGWMQKKAEIFAGKYHIPDSEDTDTVNHLNWYEATGFTRPYPGEKKVFAASHFDKRRAPAARADSDDDGF